MFDPDVGTLCKYGRLRMRAEGVIGVGSINDVIEAFRQAPTNFDRGT